LRGQLGRYLVDFYSDSAWLCAFDLGQQDLAIFNTALPVPSGPPQEALYCARTFPNNYQGRQSACLTRSFVLGVLQFFAQFLEFCVIEELADFRKHLSFLFLLGMMFHVIV
jgi:hypothetical protein